MTFAFDRLARLLVALLALALIVTGGVIAAIDRTGGMHLDLECGSCHLSQAAITEQNAATLVASQERLCTRCHERALNASHPTGFQPSSQIPADFPLDWKGDLTCSTCHRVHAARQETLRVAKRGRDFCVSCHDQNFFATMRDAGRSLMVSGHLDATSQKFRELDPFSLQCMGCHVDQASVKPVSLDPFGNIRHSSGSANHPIGSRYREAETYGGYKPQSLLPAEILLPDGKLSCVSCHDGYSQKHGKILAAGRDLCFECHDL